jgi:single-strand DNA-binding protein
MNQFIITGRTTKDAEVRYTADEKAVARFDFAVNRTFKREGEADADFFSCVAFGKVAETIEKCQVGKGTKLLINGEVRNNNYTNKDGQKVYGTQVVVNSFEFCEKKGDSPAPAKDDGFMAVPVDSDLPF